MKRNTIIATLLFLLLAAEGVKAQQQTEFAPVGAEWYYDRYYRIGPMPHGITYDRYRSIQTIDINGWECREIELYRHLDCDGVPSPYYELRYISQDGELIYEVENGQRLLLYDFGKEPGESWYAPKYQTTITVQAVSYITLNDGSVRKVLETISSSDWRFGNIVEGIGSDESVFPNEDTGMTGTPCIPGPIRCYLIDGCLLIKNEIPLVGHETPCDYEVLTVGEQQETPWMTVNFLAQEVLHVTFTNRLNIEKQLRIIDLAGNVLLIENSLGDSMEIDVSCLSSGLYVILGMGENGARCVRKFVKQ